MTLKKRGDGKKMKKRMNEVFDENDEKAVRLFTDLGMPRNLAKTLMYICQVEECKSADVERKKIQLK